MPRLAYTLSLLLLSATAVAPKTAVAVPVTDFVTIQPIDVCATATQGCAPINNLTNPVTHQAGQTVLSNPGTVQIGFIDTSTGATSRMRSGTKSESALRFFRSSKMSIPPPQR